MNVEVDLGEAGTAPVGGRPALPCLSYNNCTETVYAEGTKVPFDADKGRANAGRKLAFQAVGLVGDFVAFWGHEHVAMWTITTEDIPNPREFAKRWHSLRTHELGWLKGYLRFLEPQQRGAPHYHILAAVEWDLKPTEFDWVSYQQTCRQRCKASGAFLETREQYAARRKTKEWRDARARYVASCPKETRAIWGELNAVLPRYGFGRSELLPLRDKTGAAVYTGGYLRTGVQHRFGEWKGARLIEADRVTSQLWRNHGRQFMFNQTAERIWRYQLATWARMVGCADLDDVAHKFGPKWCFHHRDRIMQIDAPDLDFVAVNQDGKPMEPVNLRMYQEMGRVSICAAFAEANGMTAQEAYNYLYQRGGIFECTSFTNPAIRDEALLMSSRARRLAKEDARKGIETWHFKEVA